MKFLKLMKDGGKESKVWGFFFIEIKSLFSVVLLKFADGSRDAYHTHAFDSVSWVLKGKLKENLLQKGVEVYTPSFSPISTYRDTFHKVVSTGNTYVLSFRGPWVDKWEEFLPGENKFITLTHGRKTVNIYLTNS